MPRSIIRRLQQDRRWLLYASGRVDPRDANAVTMEAVYIRDNGTVTSLGSALSPAAAGFTKQTIGPFDLASVLALGEAIPVLGLRFSKAGGVDGEVRAWTMWLRRQTGRQ